MRRRALLFALVLGACGLLAGFGLGRATGGSGRPHVRHLSAAARAALHRHERLLASVRAASEQSFLVSQDAAAGSLTGPDDQHLTLTLTGVRDWVTRFADRPARDAQTVDVRDFLRRWPERFGSVPPNAVLSYRTTGSAQPRDIVLELRRPRYDAAAQTATYAARRIKRTADRLPGTRFPRRPVVYPIPRSFGAASLFVDNIPPASPCVFMNDDKFIDDDTYGEGVSASLLCDFTNAGLEQYTTTTARWTAKTDPWGEPVNAFPQSKLNPSPQFPILVNWTLVTGWGQTVTLNEGTNTCVGVDLSTQLPCWWYVNQPPKLPFVPPP